MKLADKTILNVLSKSSEAFLLLISSVVLARHFSKSEFGTFLQIMLIANTTIMLTFFGLPQSIYYFYQKVRNQRHFVNRNILISIFMGSMASILLYFIRGIIANWLNNPLLSEYGWIISLLVLFRAPTFLREPILISHGSLILNSFATAVLKPIVFIPLIIAAFLSSTLETLLKVMVIFSGVEFCANLGLMYFVFYRLRNFQIGELNSAELVEKVSLKDQLVYAFPIGISSYLSIIGQQIDQYIVSIFFSPRDFAVYSRGAMRLPIVSSVHFTINDIMMPKYVDAYQRGDMEAFINYFHLCIEKVAKIYYPLFSFFFAISPSIIILLYTKEYLEASWVLRIYLCFLIIDITVWGVIPRASGKTSVIMYTTVISLSCNIILSLLLVSIIGPIGAAIATIVSTIVAASYMTFQFCKILGVPFDAIFPWSYLAKMLLTSLAASIPVYFVNYFYPVEGIALLFAMVINTLIYFYCFIFLLMRQGLIYEDDMELLERWLRFDVKSLLRKLAFL